MDDIFASEVDAAPVTPLPYNTPAEYAPVRLRRLLGTPSVRLELIAVIVLFAIMFVPHLFQWVHRWTMPDSVQLYGLIILPLTLGWIWLARWRVMIPELDWLNEQFTEKSVMRWLVEERYEEPKRLRWTLFLAVPFTLIALWSGEPTLTGMAFVALLAAYLGYRFGTHLLHVMAFPLSFLCLLIPIPGFVLDFLIKHIQPMIYKAVTTVLTASGMQADVTPEGNPLQIFRDEAQRETAYEMYSGLLGLGYPEMLICLVGVVWYLSLIEASWGRKIASFLTAGVIALTLIVIRLWIVGLLGGWLGHSLDGRDWVNVFAFLSRIALPFIGWGIISFVLRGFRCRTYHEWVFGR